MIRDHTFERREKTPAEREARKAFREVIPGKAMTDYAKAQKSFHENRERLKAERLAREAKRGHDHLPLDELIDAHSRLPNFPDFPVPM